MGEKKNTGEQETLYCMVCLCIKRGRYYCCSTCPDRQDCKEQCFNQPERCGCVAEIGKAPRRRWNSAETKNHFRPCERKKGKDGKTG
jgi:hypothetical protein